MKEEEGREGEGGRERREKGGEKGGKEREGEEGRVEGGKEIYGKERGRKGEENGKNLQYQKRTEKWQGM